MRILAILDDFERAAPHTGRVLRHIWETRPSDLDDGLRALEARELAAHREGYAEALEDVLGCLVRELRAWEPTRDLGDALSRWVDGKRAPEIEAGIPDDSDRPEELHAIEHVFRHMRARAHPETDGE